MNLSTLDGKNDVIKYVGSSEPYVKILSAKR